MGSEDFIPRRVIKGGSHRQPQMIDTSMAYLGFRCIVRQPGPRTEGATI